MSSSWAGVADEDYVVGCVSRLPEWMQALDCAPPFDELGPGAFADAAALAALLLLLCALYVLVVRKERNTTFV